MHHGIQSMSFSLTQGSPKSLSLSNKSPKAEPQPSPDSILFPDSDEHQDLDDENEGEGHTHACGEAKNDDDAPEGEEGGHNADRFAEKGDASVAQCKSPTVIEFSSPVIAVAAPDDQVGGTVGKDEDVRRGDRGIQGSSCGKHQDTVGSCQ